MKLDSKGERVEFRAGRFRSKLSGVDSDTFPEVPRINAESLKISASVFYEGLRRTIFGVTEDNKRFTINGILLILDEKGLKMVSTDGHRLCLFQISVSQINQSLSCLIPLKAVRELKNLLTSEIKSNQKAELKIKKGSQLEFEIGNKLMTAREISGDFPNWEMVVPRAFEFFAEIKATELKEALFRVGVMADDSHRRIEFIFYPTKLVLKSESAETGSSAEEINCTFRRLRNDEGEAQVQDITEGWRIAFNSRYVIEFLALLNGKQTESRVIWKFGSNVSQTPISFEGEERLFSYVLVPLK